MSFDGVYKSGLSLIKGIGESIRFAWLYSEYGIGYKWSYPLMDSGEEPDSLIGRASLRAGNIIKESDCVPKEIGYYLCLCGIPGAVLGEILYLLSGDDWGDVPE
jgi:hypothetical protein